MRFVRCSFPSLQLTTVSQKTSLNIHWMINQFSTPIEIRFNEIQNRMDKSNSKKILFEQVFFAATLFEKSFFHNIYLIIAQYTEGCKQVYNL